MRRQNPPEASLDQVRAFEKNLNRASIAGIHALFATVSFALVALLFAAFVYDHLLKASSTTLAAFFLIALLPAVMALLAYRSTPSDPSSIVVRGLAHSRRHPRLASVSIAFKVLLRTGEPLWVNFRFHLPAKNQKSAIREPLISYVRTAIERDCTIRADVPSGKELEEAADRALEILAAEYKIPVLYSEVQGIHKVRDSYSKRDDLTPWEYLGTGTQG